MTKRCFIFLILLNVILPAFSQNEPELTDGQKRVLTSAEQKLNITVDLIHLEKDAEKGGYHLYVKKTPGVKSIILTETTRDPSGKNDSFAYRAKEYNPINGDEIRYLNGKKLESEYSKYSLVDSTVEKHEKYGNVFHIYIPENLEYGYPWERNGSVTIGKGTFINIRSFSKKYADYTGEYKDNPFMFDLKPVAKKKVVLPPPEPEPEPVESLQYPEEIVEPVVFDEIIPEPEIEPEEEIILTDEYNPAASESFQDISDLFRYSAGPESLISDILNLLENLPDESDVVFAIDATGSMKNDLETLKTELVPSLLDKLAEKKGVRLGLLFYRDYPDSFRYNGLPVKFFEFTEDSQLFQKNLNSIVIKGKEGGDIPEAVYEALYACSEFYKWRENSFKEIILIGDAEPHPHPRGTKRYSKKFVMEKIEEKNIRVNAILLPDN